MASVDTCEEVDYGDAAETTVTETSTITSIFSYTVTSSSTSHTTRTTTTTAIQTIITTSTLSTTTLTTTTFTSWRTETSTHVTSRTSTSVIILTSLTSTTLTEASTSLYPTVTVTSMNVSYKGTTVYSPTVTEVTTQTSLIPLTSVVTSVLPFTVTATTTVEITRPCAIASAVYGSELAYQVQLLREFRDRTLASTFAGDRFMRIFNKFYYSFSPAVAKAVLTNPLVGSLTRASIYPLITSLSIASMASGVLPFHSEFGILVTGVVASGMIGLIYVTPFAFFWRIRRQRFRRN